MSRYCSILKQFHPYQGYNNPEMSKHWRHDIENMSASVLDTHASVLITVQPKILVGIKFGGWAPNCHCKNIGGFLFGGSVRDQHMYIYKYETLGDFNLAVVKIDCQTTKFSRLYSSVLLQPWLNSSTWKPMKGAVHVLADAVLKYVAYLQQKNIEVQENH